MKAERVFQPSVKSERSFVAEGPREPAQESRLPGFRGPKGIEISTPAPRTRLKSLCTNGTVVEDMPLTGGSDPNRLA